MSHQFWKMNCLLAVTAGQIWAATGGNDDFANAAQLGSALPIQRACDPRIASFEEGENQEGFDSDDGLIGGSLWFRWTAPSNGRFRVVGLGRSEVVRVYSGTTLDDLLEVSDNPEASARMSSVLFDAEAGQELFLQVGYERITSFNGYRFSDESSRGTIGFVLDEVSPVQNFAADGSSQVLKNFFQVGQTSFDEARVVWTPPATGSYLIQAEQGFAIEVDGVTTNHTSSEPLSVAINSLSPVQVSAAFNGFSDFQSVAIVAELPSQDLGSAQSGEFYSLASMSYSDDSLTWTAPDDGYVIFELSSTVPEAGMDVVASDFSSFHIIDVGPFDCELLTYSGSGAIPVTSGIQYTIDLFASREESLDIVVGNFRFFSSPSSVEEYLVVATDTLNSGLSEASLQQAASSLDAALALEPNHPTANFLKAIVQLILLGQTSDFQQLLTSIGITPNANDFTETDFTIPSAEDGLPDFPTDAEGTARLAALEGVLSPRLAEVRAHLVTAQNSPVAGEDLSLNGTNLSFDEADYLGFIAFVDVFGAFLDLVTIYDLGGSLDAIVQLEREGSLDFETALTEFPNLLTVANSAAVDEFKLNMNQANTVLCAALVKASAERTDCGLHFFPPVDPLEDLGIQLGNLFEVTETVSSLFSEPFEADGFVIDLTQYSSAQVTSLRAQLPEIKNGRAVAFTIPDPTLGGLVVDSNQADFAELFDATGVLLQPSQYAQWISGFLANGLPSDLTGMQDDPDNDGDSNLEEYFFGGDPNDSTVVAQTPTADLISLPGGKELGVTFIRREESEEVNYVLATSDDLESFEFSQANVSMVGTATPLGGGRELVTFSIPLDATGGKRFVQIHAAAE